MVHSASEEISLRRKATLSTTPGDKGGDRYKWICEFSEGKLKDFLSSGNFDFLSAKEHCPFTPASSFNQKEHLVKIKYIPFQRILKEVNHPFVG